MALIRPEQLQDSGNGAEGILRRVDDDFFDTLKTNLVATTDPGASDDDVAGYVVGSLWVNVTLDKVWICAHDATAAAVWKEAGGAGGSGDVVGPGSATDNAAARFDTTTGKLLQNGVVTIGDAGEVAGVNNVDNDVLTGGGKPAHTEGRTFYDGDEHTLAVFNDEADVTHQLGQEHFNRVYNDTGSTITNGSVVYVSGNEVVEDRGTIALARADAKSTSEVIGIATHDIETATFGYVTQMGTVNDLNTSAFTAGDAVYLDETTAGTLRNSPPPEGNFDVLVGYVIKSNATTGRLLLNINANLGLAAGDAKELILDVQKGSAGTISPGDVVYITGFDVGADVPEVELADASAAGTMPAIGIARDTIGLATTGSVVVVGQLGNQDTSAYSVGDELYVSETTGQLTSTKPTGTALVQKIAQVTRSNVATGVIQIFGAGRSNDLPNLAQDNAWVGNGSGVPTATPVADLVTAGGTNVLRVDAGGEGDYTTVSAALTAAVSGDVVLVYPGDYTENITLKDGVCLVGLANRRGSVRILYNGAGPNDLVTYAGTGTTYLKDINFENNFTGSGANRCVAHTSTGTIRAEGCRFYSQYNNTIAGGNDDVYAMTAAGFLFAFSCYFQAFRLGSGAEATHRGVHITGSGTVSLYNCVTTARGGATNGNWVPFRHAGTNGTIKIAGGLVSSSLGVRAIEITSSLVNFATDGAIWNAPPEATLVACEVGGGGSDPVEGFWSFQLNLVARTDEPNPPQDGMIWYRSDVDELRARRNSVTEEIAMVSDLPSGDVVGPASSTDNAITRFNLATGKLVQDSGILIDDSDKMSAIETATFNAEHDNGTKTAAFTVDWNNGQKQRATLDATGMAITLTAPPGPGNFLIRLIQNDGTLSTVTWPASVKWPGGTAPTLTNSSGAVDIVSMYYDGTDYWAQAGLNFS